MKKKIGIVIALAVILVGIIYAYNNKDRFTSKTDGNLNLNSLSTYTEEEIKSRVDREVARGKVSNLSDLELMEKIYPDKSDYKAALFNTYYNQDPNKGLKYAGEVYMSSGNIDILKLVDQKTSKAINFTADKRFESLKEIAEKAAGNFFGSWRDIFTSPNPNNEAPFYLRNVIQVELMEAGTGYLYVLVHGNTPFQEAIDGGENLTAKESGIYKINKGGEVSFVQKFVNDDNMYKEIIYKKVGQELQFFQSNSPINLENEIAFFGANNTEVERINTELLTSLEHNSVAVDWTGYENLAPFAKQYMEEILKIKNANLANTTKDGKEPSFLKKGFLIDLDGDGVLEMVLITNNKTESTKTQAIYVYTYSENKAVNIFKYEDFSQTGLGYSFDIDGGILEEDNKKYLYIAHTENSGYVTNTNLGILTKEVGKNQLLQEEGYSNVAFMTYLSPNGKTSEYEKANFVSDSRFIKPNTVTNFQEGYYDLEKRIFGDSTDLFITDARAKVDPASLKEGETGVEDFKAPSRDTNDNLIFDGYDKNMLIEGQLLSLLLIPTEKVVDVPIIRRFRVDGEIFPADILKIRADSTGHVNASIFKGVEGFSLSKEGDNLKITKGNKSYLVEKPMVDEEGNYYVPFTTLKEMGIIARDLGYIVDLSFDGKAVQGVASSTIEDIKAKVDGEIKRGNIESTNDLELVSTMYDDVIYKQKRIDLYHKEYENKALNYAKDFFKEKGDHVFLKGLDTMALDFLDEDNDENLEEFLGAKNISKLSKSYIEKLREIEKLIKEDEEGKIEAGYIYDFDKDGLEELILQLQIKDEIIILGYSYNAEKEEAEKIISESINRRTSQKVNIGVFEEGDKSYLYLVEDYKDKVSETAIKLYEMEENQFKLVKDIYKIYDENKEETYSYQAGGESSDKTRDYEKDFKELREKLFKDNEVYFYSDGVVTDVEYSKYPNNYKMTLENMYRYLLVESDEDIKPALIRRFIIDKGIYPAGVLKISTDSTGYVNSLILNDIKEVEVTTEENKVTIKNGEKTKTISQTITDDEGNIYIPLSVIKEEGLVLEDKGNLIVLGNK